MVYHSIKRLTRFLQPNCLLCGCRQHHHRHAPAPAFFGLCAFCHAALPFIENACRQCGIPLPDGQSLCGTCISEAPAFDFSCCAVTYEGCMMPLIQGFKASHCKATGRLLGELMLAQLQTLSPAVDIAIPSPMHWQRNLQRGNNHATLLAQPVCRQLQLPLYTGLVERIQATPAQKALNAQQRKKNLRHAFRCTESVQGLRIAIIDDVITTGSTMQAIAHTLKRAGAREVHCWAIARTPKH